MCARDVNMKTRQKKVFKSKLSKKVLEEWQNFGTARNRINEWDFMKQNDLSESDFYSMSEDMEKKWEEFKLEQMEVTKSLFAQYLGMMSATLGKKIWKKDA